MPNLSERGPILSREGGRNRFCQVGISSNFGLRSNLKHYISTRRKDIKKLVNSFMYKGLESNYANYEQNRTHFEQGGEQVLPGRNFWESRNLTFLAHPLGGGYGGLSKATLGENLSSLVCKGENHLPLSFSVLEK